MITTQEEEIKVTSYGGYNNEISIDGFSEENFEKMLSAIRTGSHYVQIKDGKLITIPIWEELPKPAEDKDMTPFWRRYTGSKQLLLFEEYEHSKEKAYSPSLVIQHLCAYNYTDEGYKEEAEKLESYGFECLRSRRGSDGKYWEIWYLPGLFSAKGDLKSAIEFIEDKEVKLQTVLRFLAKKVSFGTLNVSVQRMCAVLD